MHRAGSTGLPVQPALFVFIGATHRKLGLLMEPDTKRHAKAAFWGAIWRSDDARGHLRRV